MVHPSTSSRISGEPGELGEPGEPPEPAADRIGWGARATNATLCIFPFLPPCVASVNAQPY